jgi:hypothetical protein
MKKQFNSPEEVIDDYSKRSLEASKQGVLMDFSEEDLKNYHNQVMEKIKREEAMKDKQE